MKRYQASSEYHQGALSERLEKESKSSREKSDVDFRSANGELSSPEYGFFEKKLRSDRDQNSQKSSDSLKNEEDAKSGLRSGTNRPKTPNEQQQVPDIDNEALLKTLGFTNIDSFFPADRRDMIEFSDQTDTKKSTDASNEQYNQISTEKPIQQPKSRLAEETNQPNEFLRNNGTPKQNGGSKQNYETRQIEFFQQNGLRQTEDKPIRQDFPQPQQQQQTYPVHNTEQNKKSRVQTHAHSQSPHIQQVQKQPLETDTQPQKTPPEKPGNQTVAQQSKAVEPLVSNKSADETNRAKFYYTGRDRSPPNTGGTTQPQITTITDTANTIGRSLRDTSPRLVNQNQKVDPRVFTYFGGRLKPNTKNQS